ncbi:hypothetical protein [Huintestinicola sp.]|uniref:hypothetical protein n=1 Tax=Huintestinicola sp. TaxID=2981661 RepID=UPI003D7CCB3C
MKKAFRTGAALCLSAAALTAIAASAYAEAIDFEDGNYSFVSVKTDDGGDLSVLSVEEFNGSMQLKVDVQDCSLLPKILFSMNDIVGTENLSDIDKIYMDITFASKDGVTAPGWIGGCLGTAGADDTPAWDQSDFEGGEYENPVSEPMTIERKFLLPSKKFVSGTEGSNAQLMRWGTEVPYYMYVDNIRILDADGNEMPLMISAAPAEEAVEEAPAETPAEEAPAETPAEETPAEAAAETPASDGNTSSSKTGNTAAASVAAIAVCAAGLAVISRRK